MYIAMDWIQNIYNIYIYTFKTKICLRKLCTTIVFGTLLVYWHSPISFFPWTLLMSLLPSLMSLWSLATTSSSVHGQFTRRPDLVLEAEVHVGDVGVCPVVSDEHVLHIHLAARRLAPDW